MSSARSFRSVFMVASCAAAALGCYLVSLRVASERSQLEDVEGRIVMAQRDMRVLQTEIGTRGRLAQLERWNVRVLALSAPAAQQFVSSDFELAKLTQTQPKVDFHAPIVMAAAPAPNHVPAIGQESRDDAGVATTPAENAGPRVLLHQASLKIETREVPARAATTVHLSPAPSIDRPAAAAKPAHKKSVDKPGLAAAKPVTKPIRLAKNDPLAPLPDKPSRTTGKDSGSAR